MAEKKHPTALDRLIQKAIGNDESIGNADDPSQGKYPLVVTWITRVEVGKERIKEPARISIRAVPGGYTFTLTDNTLKVAIDAFTTVLDDGLACLEETLGRPNPPIRLLGKNLDITLRKRKKGD